MRSSFFNHFFYRTRDRESSMKPTSNRMHSLIHHILRAMGVFLIAPLLTILILGTLEMCFLPSTCKSVFEQAVYNVFLRSDVIFLAFSLALSAILEWTISSNAKDAPALFVVLEGIIGLLSLIFYVVEEMLKMLSKATSYDAYSTAVMANRALIHAIFLFAVIFVGFSGYLRRIMYSQDVKMFR